MLKLNPGDLMLFDPTGRSGSFLICIVSSARHAVDRERSIQTVAEHDIVVMSDRIHVTTARLRLYTRYSDVCLLYQIDTSQRFLPGHITHVV